MVTEIISKTFNIPMEITIPVVDISFGLPDAAGRYLEEKGADKQFIEDITFTMILGSISANRHASLAGECRSIAWRPVSY